jgi:hypothetical protein
MLKSIERIIINKQNCDKQAEVARANNKMPEPQKRRSIISSSIIISLFLSVVFKSTPVNKILDKTIYSAKVELK